MSKDDKDKSKRSASVDRDQAELRDRQRVIGRQLRRMYDDVVNEPVPDEFLKLLAEADEAKSEPDEDEGSAGGAAS